MLRHVVSAALLAFLSTSAIAQVPPVFNWTGFYIGGQAGGAWGDEEFTGTGVAGTTELDGFLGGGHAGIQRQFGWALFGIEGDGEFADINGSFTGGCPTCTTTTELDWMASIRGRIGVAIDRWLVYGTAGAAYADIENTLQQNPPGTPLEAFDTSRWGVTVGGGIEFGVTPFFTVGGEYRYTDFGGDSVDSLIAFRNFSFDYDDLRIHAVRARASLRYGGTP